MKLSMGYMGRFLSSIFRYRVYGFASLGISYNLVLQVDMCLQHTKDLKIRIEATGFDPSCVQVVFPPVCLAIKEVED